MKLAEMHGKSRPQSLGFGEGELLAVNLWYVKATVGRRRGSRGKENGPDWQMAGKIDTLDSNMHMGEESEVSI